MDKLNEDALAEKAYAAAAAGAADPVKNSSATSTKPVTIKPAVTVAAAVAPTITTVIEAPAVSKVAAKAAFVATAKAAAKTAKPVTAKVAVVAKAAPKAAKAKPAAAKPATIKIAVKASKPAPKITLKSKSPVTAKLAKTVTPATVPARVAATATKGKTMIEEATQKFTAEATKMAGEAKARTETLVADMTTRAQAATVKGQEMVRDAVEFSKGNVDAMVEAGKIAAKGAGEIGQEHVAFARTSVEDGTAAVKRYAGVKSVGEFFQLYTEMTKTQVDALVRHTAKTSEMSLKLANDAFQPLSSRFALAATKLKSAA